MAAHELIEFLTNGNITNSVNYPNASMPHSGDVRICVMHKNIPNVISQISSALSSANINIENMINRSKKDYAYTIVEINGSLPSGIKAALSSIDSVIKVNILLI